MTPQKGTQFSYVFKSLQNDKKFRINAGDLRTAEYQLKVFPKPIILGLDIALDYPAYIRKMPEKVENTGDLSIPEGTTVKWRILTKDADRIIMNLGGSLKNLEKPASGDILYTPTIYREHKLLPDPGKQVFEETKTPWDTGSTW